MTHFDVFYRGKPVGKVTVQTAESGVQFDAVCTLPDTTVLRLCGGRNEKTVLIGVLAPYAGYWHIGRTLSYHTLAEYGFDALLPDTFWLTEHPDQSTGDRLLDEALRAGTVKLIETPNGLAVACPFDCSKPSPLAFALSACSIENEMVLFPLDALSKIKQKR